MGETREHGDGNEVRLDGYTLNHKCMRPASDALKGVLLWPLILDHMRRDRWYAIELLIDLASQ